MRKPGFGETSLGAVVGAISGSIGGLFCVGVPPAIVGHNLALMFATPILALISWVVCLVVGWFAGGQLGSRLGIRLKSQRAEIAAGLVGGLIPVILIALWSWYMVTPH